MEVDLSSITPKWVEPPKNLIISDPEVHVWRAYLNVTNSRLEEYEKILSNDETDRANRYHFQKDKNHFIAARGALRTILGLYLRKAPSDIRFFYNKYHKPFLKGEVSELRFNISHSAWVALYAIALKRDVGIDIEKINPTMADMQVAENFFSNREVMELQLLPKQKQKLAFFNCWTRKEAYIKAKGMGLSIPLKTFDVTLIPGEPAALIHSMEDEQEISRWSMVSLIPENGYTAALAITGKNNKIKYWQWSWKVFKLKQIKINTINWFGRDTIIDMHNMGNEIQTIIIKSTQLQ
jgi:4'-phosphopantetheinyl transferase